jgi:hypothetical protein
MTEPQIVKQDTKAAQRELVKVAGAQNQAEAEFVQDLLREAGVPSMLRRTPGFDVPDFLAAGPRDVLVPGWAAERAHDVLVLADLGPLLPAPRGGDAPHRILAGLLVALALVAIVAWCATELFT